MSHHTIRIKEKTIEFQTNAGSRLITVFLKGVHHSCYNPENGILIASRPEDVLKSMFDDGELQELKMKLNEFDSARRKNAQR
jgi:hypothetical protein